MAYQRLFPEWVAEPERSPSALAENLGILPAESNGDSAAAFIAEILAANPKEVRVINKAKRI